MWKKVVVTGAAGFIGSHLCKRLSDEGVETIIGIDSLRSGDWSRAPESLQKIEKDITEITDAEWVEHLSGVDVLFHLAAEKYNSSKSTPNKLLNVNILATERLFRLAANCQVKRTIFSSSLYAYGSLGPEQMAESDVASPITLYGASKLMGEGILRALDREIGLSWNVARLFFVYGPRQHAEGGYKSVILTNFERLMRNERPVIHGDGNQQLDYVYIDDCVQALVVLASSDTDRRIVNVSTGRAVSVNLLTEQMIEVSSKQIAPMFGPIDWTNGSSRSGNPDLMLETFGWSSQISLREGLTNIYGWMAGRDV